MTIKKKANSSAFSFASIKQCTHKIVEASRFKIAFDLDNTIFYNKILQSPNKMFSIITK